MRTPPRAKRPHPVPRVESAVIGRFVEAAESARELNERLGALIRRGTPVIEKTLADGSALPEGESVATFLWHDPDAEEVLIFINRLTDEQNLSDSMMQRVGHSEFWSISFRMKNTWRASYCMMPAYASQAKPWICRDGRVRLHSALGLGAADPFNRQTCLNRAGVPMSVVELEACSPQPYRLDAAACSALPEVEWETHSTGRRFAVCEVGDTGPDSPLIFFFDGQVWAAMGLPQSLGAAYAAGEIAAMRMVLVHSGGIATRWRELDGTVPMADFLADGLLGELAQRGVRPCAERTAVVGQSLGGLSALLAGVQRPECFGVVVSSSASLWRPVVGRALQQRIGEGSISELAHVRWYVEVGEQESVLLAPHRELVEQLSGTCVSLHFEIYNGGHDYACWRGSIITALARMFPAAGR